MLCAILPKPDNLDRHEYFHDKAEKLLKILLEQSNSSEFAALNILDNDIDTITYNIKYRYVLLLSAEEVLWSEKEEQTMGDDPNHGLMLQKKSAEA
ncbi:hypothetical protein DPMN_167877 [Dreissena polymorpha]|uniref:Uncharacterized protein n=1 Tax=Dreissena polymorpha TaxID=45954 RepID=A0A9D4F1J5_DREPO|nr:hypothetical protein DPMN_167877 [Dreissena polymorpha]